MKKFFFFVLSAAVLAACTKDKEEVIKVKSLSILPESATLFCYDQMPSLALQVEPAEALDGKTVTWGSSNPEILSVSEDGVLTCLVDDIEENQLPVTITATVDNQTAQAVITLRGEISKYDIVDLTAECGFLILDRNLGATEAYNGENDAAATGNFYQWGNNNPVATGDEVTVNENFVSGWNKSCEGWMDWTIPENTPCPKGWTVPNTDQVKALADKTLSDYEFGESEENEKVEAALKLVRTGSFRESYSLEKRYNTPCVYLWSCTWNNYDATETGWKGAENESVNYVFYYEYNSIPTRSKAGNSDYAQNIRCVKVAN